MNLIRKMAAPAAALAVAALLFGAYATAAHAQVPPFTAYGQGLSEGDVVEASVGGTSCGTATADADGNWLLQIASDAPCTPADGDEISFTLNGSATDAVETWNAGGAPADVAGGIVLSASDGGDGGDGDTPPPADTGTAGFAAADGGSASFALLALAGLTALVVGGARAATRTR